MQTLHYLGQGNTDTQVNGLWNPLSIFIFTFFFIAFSFFFPLLLHFHLLSTLSQPPPPGCHWQLVFNLYLNIFSSYYCLLGPIQRCDTPVSFALKRCISNLFSQFTDLKSSWGHWKYNYNVQFLQFLWLLFNHSALHNSDSLFCPKVILVLL